MRCSIILTISAGDSAFGSVPMAWPGSAAINGKTEAAFRS
jgi:hypothetical protein